MKITTTITKELNIELPAFTKTLNGGVESYYCIKGETDIIGFRNYKISEAIVISRTNYKFDAFAEGFELITKEEFFEKYNYAVDTLYDDMKELQDEMCDDRTDDEIEQERKEAEDQRNVDAHCDKSNEY
jgi:hypothetical protein